MDKKSSEVKKNDKKFIKPLIICIAAVLVIGGIVTGVILANRSKNDPASDTDVTGGAVIVDSDSAKLPPETTVLVGSDDDTTEPVSDTAGTTGTDDTTSPADSTSTPADDTSDDVDPDDAPDIVIDDLPETVMFVTEGEESIKWPKEDIPSTIPEFKNIKKMYNCSFADTEVEKEWYMGWDADEADYDKWMTAVLNAGFNPSKSVVGYYGNGTTLLDITTEDNPDGTVYVSLDIFEMKIGKVPSAIGKIYPAFLTTGTFYDYVDTGSEYTVIYHCSADWDSDIENYVEKLMDAGFDVSKGMATKTVDGKTYTVTWEAFEIKSRETISFTY